MGAVKAHKLYDVPEEIFYHFCIKEGIYTPKNVDKLAQIGLDRAYVINLIKTSSGWEELIKREPKIRQLGLSYIEGLQRRYRIGFNRNWAISENQEKILEEIKKKELTYKEIGG